MRTAGAKTREEDSLEDRESFVGSDSVDKMRRKKTKMKMRRVR